MRKLSTLLAAVCLTVTAMITPSTAEEAEDTEEVPGPSPFDILLGESERCINTVRIDRTEVIDDRTVVFYLNGGDIYVNRLPHRCPGLRSRQAFMYKTTTSTLCSIDTIRVLDSFGGGLRPGIGCGLGEFHPVSPGTIDQMKAFDDESR